MVEGTKLAGWFGLVFALFMAPNAEAAQEERPLSERERAVHLLSRFTYGPRPGDVEALVEQGTEAWLKEQFAKKANSNSRLDALLSRFETITLTPRECYDHTTTVAEPNETRERARERLMLTLLPMRELTRSVALRASLSDRQVEEVLCDFWRNHLNVSFTKGAPIPNLIPDYERNVITANALGDFPTMLSASAKHPAMLYYLDNRLSRRPPSKQELAVIRRRASKETGSKERGLEAASIASQRGLNENYARELLELHTLGVDNHYKQKDVLAVAEALTGWTVDNGPEGSWEFKFAPEMHMLDDRRILGRSLSKDREHGEKQGEALLEMLAKHKGTSKFIATKLVRYFVNDEPPASLVKAVAKKYRDTDGDISAMMQTIVESDEFWSRENYLAKFKTPYEFVISALRATDAEIENLSVTLLLLENMGQHVYHCDDPTGWYDTAEAWLDPGVLALRWDFAMNLAADDLRGVRVPESYFDDIPEEATPLEILQRLIRKVLPGGAGARTLSLLHSVVRDESDTLGRTRLMRRLLGLLLGCPEFQEQ